MLPDVAEQRQICIQLSSTEKTSGLCKWTRNEGQMPCTKLENLINQLIPLFMHCTQTFDNTSHAVTINSV